MKAHCQANHLTVNWTNAKFASPTYYKYDKNGSLTDIVEPTGMTNEVEICEIGLGNKTGEGTRLEYLGQVAEIECGILVRSSYDSAGFSGVLKALDDLGCRNHKTSPGGHGEPSRTIFDFSRLACPSPPSRLAKPLSGALIAVCFDTWGGNGFIPVLRARTGGASSLHVAQNCNFAVRAFSRRVVDLP